MENLRLGLTHSTAALAASMHFERGRSSGNAAVSVNTSPLLPKISSLPVKTESLVHSTIEFYFVSFSKQPNAESKLPEDAAASVAGRELARKWTVAEDLAVAGGKEEVVEQTRETAVEVVDAIFNGRLGINVAGAVVVLAGLRE